MEHCKIKCKKEKQYEQIKVALDLSGIEYYQNSPNKSIHLCGFEKKKDMDKLLHKYGLKKYDIKVDKPKFEEVEEYEMER